MFGTHGRQTTSDGCARVIETCGARQIRRPCRGVGVATDFQPSYALETPGVTRDELVVRFDPRSPRLHRLLARRLSRVHDLPQGVSRAVVVATGLDRGHWLHGRPTSQKPPYDLAFRFPDPGSQPAPDPRGVPLVFGSELHLQVLLLGDDRAPEE
jgi:hypothetical protein